MTYEQSLQNIKTLKELISAFDNEWFVFFDFRDEVQFEIIFCRFADWDFWCEFLRTKRKDALPWGRVHVTEDDEVVFYYSDVNIVWHQYNMIKEELYDDMVLSLRFAEWEFNRAMSKLVAQFKKA